MNEEKRKILDENYVLSQENELLIRRIIRGSDFDLDAFIDYICSHEFIDYEIFEKTLINRDIQLTYVKFLKKTFRTDFINRIPVYFYDMNKNHEESMNILFEDYYKAVTGKNIASYKYGFQSFSDYSFDFEYLYSVLEDLQKAFITSLENIMQYLHHQDGNYVRWWLLETLHKYAKLCSTEEQKIFPQNLLYSYNALLEENGDKPIVYGPECDFNGKPLVKLDGDALRIGGYFPIDEDGKLVKKWIGIWAENLDTPTPIDLEETRHNNEIFVNHRGFTPGLKRTLLLKVRSDTIVFTLKKVKRDYDAFGKFSYDNIWEQVYIGPRLVEFDNKAIERIRNDKNIQLKDLAEGTGVNIRTLQRIESGESSPEGLNLIKIMQYLGISSYMELIKKNDFYDNDLGKFSERKYVQEEIIKK